MKFLDSLKREYIKAKLMELRMNRDVELNYLGGFKYVELFIRRIKATPIYKHLYTRGLGKTWMFRFIKRAYHKIKLKFLHRGICRKLQFPSYSDFLNL